MLNELAWEYRFDKADSARLLLQSSLRLAESIGFLAGMGNARNFLGVLESGQGDHGKAIGHFESALEIRRRLQDTAGVSNILNNLGNELRELGRYPEAYSQYEECQQIRYALGDTLRALRVTYNLAILCEEMGTYKEALGFIYQFLSGATQLSDSAGVANAWNIIGNILIEQDNFPEAEDAYRKALDMHRSLGNEREVATVLLNLANLSDTKGERLLDDAVQHDSVRQYFDTAVHYLSEVMEIRERDRDLPGLAEAYNNRGLVLKNLGSYQEASGQNRRAQQTWSEAEKWLDKALAIRQAEGDRFGLMELFNGFGDIYRRQGRLEEAFAMTNRYYKLALELGSKKYQVNGLKDLARLHAKRGDYKQAYAYFRQHADLRFDVFQEDFWEQQKRMQAIYIDKDIKLAKEKADMALRQREAELKAATVLRNSFLVGGAFLLGLAILLLNRNRIIQRERQRSESLLLNILPKVTALELKSKGKAQARRFDSVSVLFTDFKSFTQMAEQMPAEQLVAELDGCFQGFDDIADRHGIEKIKTIGDAYLCVAGLPTPADDHAVRLVRAALEMQDFLDRYRKEQLARGALPFYCRIGIHSGPVVAGVVGKRKFAYDVWGDTVNMAARMEQSGEINEINVSLATYLLIQQHFRCESRGKVDAKNKGLTDMFFVKGPIIDA
jgi:class 3 adenylate cyclase